ncbi:MAG: cytochrome c3 family protein [Planctomycetia bacterium]|nr:cytochrome c3 family protein [Planctomycetia bacterium]
MRWLRTVPPGSRMVLAALALILLAYWVYGQTLFSPGPLSTRSRGSRELGGVRTHADLTHRCSVCHPGITSSQRMGNLCMDCHTDVRQQIEAGDSVHGRIENVLTCRACHTEHRGSEAPLTVIAHIDHARTGFPLTGGHEKIACASCHKDNVFKETPKSCVFCHTEPAVHRSKFGTDCATCHTTATWKGGRLTQEFHTFPLTGGHEKIACASCHKDNVFKETPQSCVSCHAEPAVHRSKFGTDCATCHTTATWKGGRLTQEFHTFPLLHGKRNRDGQCSLCHLEPNTYRTYSCFGCHEHDRGKMERKHREERVKDISKCVDCHPTGREHRNSPPKKSELLTQRAPSVATGKALMESHEDAPPVELDLQDIRTKAALLAFLRSP